MKTAGVILYGRWGDMFQAANILPGLKRAGYHVTFVSLPKWAIVLKNDPHIDQWLYTRLGDEIPTFDLTIRLQGVIVGTLLADRSWSTAPARHSINYHERIAEVAGVPLTKEARFYPTEDEKPIRSDGFHIVWCLAGSTFDKWNPHQNEAIQMVLDEMPEATITLVGDESCQELETRWAEFPRVQCKSGRLPIRNTLALAQVADCVVGPETGVLNAVAFEANGKVVMLSHSGVDNLTKHWTNTESLYSDAPCHPCHRIHTTTEHCTVDEHGAAYCQGRITARQIADAIGKHYKAWREVQP